MAYGDYDINYIVYIIQGCIMFFVNVLVVASIGRFAELRKRKEYVIVAGLALGDAFNGFAYLTAGTQRSYRVYFARDNISSTPWDCYTIYNFFWNIGDPMANLMLVVVSVDRLIAVSFPMRYYQFTRTYALRFVGSMLAVSCVWLFVSLYISWTKRDQYIVTSICYSEDALVEDWYNEYYYLCMSIFQFISIAAYIPVLVIQQARTRKKITPKTKDGKSTETERQQKKREEELARQRRLVITLGMSSAFTFFFGVVPNFLQSFIARHVSEEDFAPISVLLAIITNMNPILNFFLYITRHKDMRAAVKALVLCKKKVDSGGTKTTTVTNTVQVKPGN